MIGTLGGRDGFLETTGTLMSPTNMEHSAGGIVLGSGKILLVYQRSTRSWAFPKGHIEDGESPLQAAEREIREETGVTALKLICSLGTYERPTARAPEIRKRITLFLFTAEDVELCPSGADVVACRWVAIADVSGLLTYQDDVVFFGQHLRCISKAAKLEQMGSGGRGHGSRPEETAR